MSDEEPLDTEDDEDLQRWHDPWGLSDRENEIALRWFCIGFAIFLTVIIAGIVYCYLVNGNA